MLCAGELVAIDCPVDIEAGEYACIRISNIRLDMTKIQGMIAPILRRLVNPPNHDGQFDEVVKPLEHLENRLPGISDVAGVSIVLLKDAMIPISP